MHRDQIRVTWLRLICVELFTTISSDCLQVTLSIQCFLLQGGIANI